EESDRLARRPGFARFLSCWRRWSGCRCGRWRGGSLNLLRWRRRTPHGRSDGGFLSRQLVDDHLLFLDDRLLLLHLLLEPPDLFLHLLEPLPELVGLARLPA